MGQHFAIAQQKNKINQTEILDQILRARVGQRENG